jgi:hypothetical protein
MRGESLIGSWLWNLVGTSEKAVGIEAPIVRIRTATDPKMIIAVSQLNSCMKYADPKVFVDDEIIPGENIFSLLFRR